MSGLMLRDATVADLPAILARCAAPRDCEIVVAHLVPEYLEACLATIAAREPEVMAFAFLNEAGARDAADASTARYRAGSPLSPIDGLTIGIKDLIETADMPTQMGCGAFAGNFLYSTGANETAGRYTRGHFDWPMRNCTVALDDSVVVSAGKVND